MIEQENITIDLNEIKNINYSRYSFIFCENVNKKRK